MRVTELIEGTVESVSVSRVHSVSKKVTQKILLVEGLGVSGDAHFGTTVQHVARVRRDPTQPNRRQVHLIHGELHDALRAAGFSVAPGVMGENITTRGVDLLGLPTGTILAFQRGAIVEVTGLRNPCRQLDGVQQGLLQAVLDRDELGNVVRKSGIMAIVLRGGQVVLGDWFTANLPPGPHHRLEPV